MGIKKNTGKKGKKLWAKTLDTTAYKAQMQESAIQASLKQKVSKLIAQKKKENGTSALFKVQTNPDEKTTNKLARDRFFAKPSEIPIGIERKIDNLAKKHQRNLSNVTESPAKTQPIRKAGLYDMWGGPAQTAEPLTKSGARKAKHTKEGLIEVPAVLKPHEGQSYNPSSQSHFGLLQNVVSQDEKLEFGVKNPSKVKDFTKRIEQSLKSKPVARPKSKKEAKVWEEMLARKKVKDLKTMEYNYGKYLKESTQEHKDHTKKMVARQAHEEDIEEKLRTGVLPPVRRKIGRKHYVPRIKEFEDLDTMKGTLKDTSGNTGELLRDQYDNVFRTGKIEVPTGKMKNRRFGTYKVHNIYDKSMKTRVIKTQKVAKKGEDLIVVK